MKIQIGRRFVGPPNIGHGGYVAGLLANGAQGAVQVTLRKPTPVDKPLELLERTDGRRELRDGDELIAEAEPARLELDVPKAPSLAQAVAAEAAASDALRGAHPSCFGCGIRRPDGDALKIFPGPCEIDGRALVTAPFRSAAAFAGADGWIEPGYAIAALDCPGAFAFLARGVRAGLLGRIVVQAHRPARADREYLIAGWQIGQEGRKLFAGTALFDADGELYASARATWFGFR